MPPKAPAKPMTFKTPDGKEFTSRAEWRDYMMATFYTFKNITDDAEPHVKAPDSIQGQMFDIGDCSDCTLVVMDHTEQVQIDQLKNCKVFIGSCASSLFIRNCVNCTFYTACQQLRLREVTNSTFFCYSKGEVHIEFSTGLKFAPFHGGYPEQAQHMQAANLDPTHNCWYDVYDHNDPDKTHKNWTLLTNPADWGKKWFPAGACDQCILQTSVGSVGKSQQVGESFSMDQIRTDAAAAKVQAREAMPPPLPPSVIIGSPDRIVKTKVLSPSPNSGGTHREVCVVGSTMMDFVSYTDKLPSVGETRHGNLFEKNFGGKGANQAVQVSNLGVGCCFIGSVGADIFGDEYKQNFESADILAVLDRCDSASTGIASITVEDSGQNTIVIIPGANTKLGAPFVGYNTKHIAEATVLLCQNEISTDATAAALTIARETKTISILNPAPANAEARSLVPLCDILCPNETELSIITDMPTTTIDEIKLSVRKLLSADHGGGCSIVLVTLGEQGAFVARRKADGSVDEQTFGVLDAVTAIDTVGAGDSFLGTFAANIARGASLEASIRRGIHVASLSVTRKGSQKSYYNLSEILPEQRPPPLCDAPNKVVVYANVLEK